MTEPTLTLQDIAVLARVRRPVVSMWRKRPNARGLIIPFPSPVGSVNGVEKFNRDDIVDWLEQTGRGNNKEARLDAPALSAPSGASLEDLVALLCLHRYTEKELVETTAQERFLIAKEVDPRDEFLLGEIRSMRASKDTLRFIDDLIEASYGLAEALERLERSQVSREVGVRDLTTEAVELIRTFVKACALHLGPENIALIHAGDGSMLALTLSDDFSSLVVQGDGQDKRALRQRAAIRGIETSIHSTDQGIRLLSIVGSAPEQALDAIDGVVMDLAVGDIAVMIGPASLLCDELQGSQDQKRAYTLRPGNLHVALRLPRGLWREAHRQALGVWICVGGISTSRPLVADLAAIEQTKLTASDLAADVAGALAQTNARSFRYARQHELQKILSTRIVVPRGTHAIKPAKNAAHHLDRINTSTLVTMEHVPSFDVLVKTASGSAVLQQRSLGELKDLQLIQLKRGSRIHKEHNHPQGSVDVLSANDDTAIKLDPFDAASFYTRANRTEPGDIIFTDKPHPKAKVDHQGGSLVASPSRILRLTPTVGIGPQAVAAIINQLPEGIDEWQTWNIPILEVTQAKQLEESLLAATKFEKSMHQRLTAINDLKKALIDGIAAGAVTIETQVATQ